MTNQHPTIPVHVAIDTFDGMIFWRGTSGTLFTAETVAAFVDHRNCCLITPRYIAAAVVPDIDTLRQALTDAADYRRPDDGDVRDVDYDHDADLVDQYHQLADLLT